MVQFQFKGLMAPVFTSFNKDLNVVTDKINDYAKYLANNNIKGILVSGTTGEGVSMTYDERRNVAENWIRAAKDNKQTVMVQIGGTYLRAVKDLAKHAEEKQADAILCLPDLFYKPKNADELIDYIKIICQVVPKMPVLYYHLPKWTGVTINMPEFLRKAQTIDNFVGIKFTSNDLDEGLECIKVNPTKYTIFLGSDKLLLAALSLGFDSAIATSFNMFPQRGVEIFKYMQEKRIEEAMKAQEQLTKRIEIVVQNGDWVPQMKAAMNLLTNIEVGLVRPPLLDVTFNDQIRLKSLLQ